ncbi:MAG TPA: ASKHA domain-containing protein [Terriglobia bacterium]|nr:ASKHA domain-containing protein [Terriglobia bacterium]
MPLDETLEVEVGTPLLDILFAYGVEFPCGGEGRCRGCRIKVLDGSLPVTIADQDALTTVEIEAGWRLACQSYAEKPMTLEIAQWEIPILSDDTRFDYEPAEGLGAAIDVGTTTLVVQLLDLSNGQVLAVKTALNPQAIHGADVMSRIQYALAEGNPSRGKLTLEIREVLGNLLLGALNDTKLDSTGLRNVVLVGNTVMHHLFCGIHVEPLSHVPFEPVRDGLETLSSPELGWIGCGDPDVHFLPCVGGFVGSDILAGVLATGLADSNGLSALADLGTNGEIVVGNCENLICASTAAGPAFEAGRIRMGMRAALGAITGVSLRGNQLHCHVLGNVAARGICGSGLVDAVSAGLELGSIQPNGRLSNCNGVLELQPPVNLTQSDIRELQLAKGAIAAGLRVLLEKIGARLEDLCILYLAGAFGNYVNRHSARRIGLLEVDLEHIHPAGNTALRGAKMALLSKTLLHQTLPEVRSKIRHISLGSDPRFQELFVENMNFPA